MPQGDELVGGQVQHNHAHAVAVNNIQLTDEQKKMTVEQMAYLVHIGNVINLKTRITDEAAELRTRQDKIKAAHDVMAELNNSYDNDGALDLRQNEPLKQKLLALRGHDFNIPMANDNINPIMQFTPQKATRLMENLNYKLSEYESENQTQMKKVQTLHTESEQSLMIVKNTQSAIDKAKRASIQGIKG